MQTTIFTHNIFLKLMRLSYLLFFIIFISCKILGQSTFINKDSIVIIDKIIVAGNKKTKNSVITREVFFKEGDTLLIQNFTTLLQQSKDFIFNTTLFVKVDAISHIDTNKRATVIFNVKERWYIFPLPYFKLIDRNLTDWYVNHNADFSRVNYGIKFFHNNFSGYNDKLNLWLITGYNNQISVRYDLPYLNKAQTKGLNIGFLTSKQKEINYFTNDSNRQQFLTATDGFAKNISRFDVSYSYRPGQQYRQNFRLSYTQESINNFVLLDSNIAIKKRPAYYGDSSTTAINYCELGYGFSYQNANYNAYPTKGILASAAVGTRLFAGANNITSFGGSILYAFSPHKKMYIQTFVEAKAKLFTNNSFINQGLFGFGDFGLRGQEKYVVDGMAGVLGKLTLGYEFLNVNLKLPIKSQTYKSIPFKFYCKVFSDVGYSHNPLNPKDLFSNRWMKTWGIGLDVVSIYDFVLRIEYSFNRLGEQGFFFGVRE
jgi:outer membrane protein assembly factor BamA